MEESKEKIMVKSVLLSPRTIILYIIMLLIFIPLHAYNMFIFYRYWYGYPFLVLLITSALVLVLGKIVKLKPQEIAVIYAASGISAGTIYFTGFDSWFQLALLPMGGEAFDKIKDIVPAWMKGMVPVSILQDMYPGGKSLPLANWIPAIITQVFMICVPLLWGLGWSTLFSKRWIREERLSFPNAIPAYTIIQTYDKMVSPKRSSLYSRASMWIWLGFLFGLLTHGMLFFLAYSEMATGGPVLPIHEEHLDFATDFSWLAPYLPGAHLSWGEGGWGLWMWLPVTLLIPLDILATAIIWYFWWFWLFPAIGNTVGLFPTRMDAGAISGGKESWCIYGSDQAYFGIVLGIFIISVYTARSYLINSIRNAYRRVKPEDPDDVPDLWTWSLIGGSFIILLVFWTATGANPLALLFILILNVVIMVGLSRAIAETHWGRWWGVVSPLSLGTSAYGWTNPMYSTQVLTTRLAENYIWNGIFAREWAVGPAYLNEFYKIGEETNTPRKALFITMIITMIISTLLGYIAMYGLAYSWGLNTAVPGWYERGILSGAGTNIANGLQYGTVNPMDFQPPLFWQSSAIGLVITLLVYFARMRYPWLWINPIGFILGGTADTWFRAAAIVGFVIVFIVTKIGGAEAYKKYLVPFAVGAFVSSYAAELTARLVSGRGVYYWNKLLGIEVPQRFNFFGGVTLIIPILFFALPIAGIVVPYIWEKRKQGAQ